MNVCSYQQKKLKSNPLNYRALESYPQATRPLANQSQQIAVVNISDSTDLNKDIMIISLLYGTLEYFRRFSATTPGLRQGGKKSREQSKHKGCQSMWQANWVDLFSKDEWRD